MWTLKPNNGSGGGDEEEDRRRRDPSKLFCGRGSKKKRSNEDGGGDKELSAAAFDLNEPPPPGGGDEEKEEERCIDLSKLLFPAWGRKKKRSSRPRPRKVEAKPDEDGGGGGDKSSQHHRPNNDKELSAAGLSFVLDCPFCHRPYFGYRGLGCSLFFCRKNPADEDARCKNRADYEDTRFKNRADEDARFKNRADDEDAHCKKVPADFDLNEPPPEEAGQEIQGGGELPEVAPAAAEGDEQNISSTLGST